MSRYTGRGKRRSRVLPVLTLAAAVAAVILLTVAAKGVAPVVHGAWQVTDRFKACSVCGYAFARLLPDKYRPHCGAKMDGGADHEDD